MARARDDAGHEVINLASDSEDEVLYLPSDSEDEALSEDKSAHFDAHDRDQDDIAHFPVDLDEYDLFGALNAHHSPTYETPNGIIDLTHIPDIDVPPSDLALDNFEAPVNNDLCEDHHLVTEAVALQIVLDVLPDVSVDHVLNIIREKTTDLTRTNAQCHDIVTQLLDGEVYPKEEDETSKKKRKRDDEDDWKEYEKSERDPGVLTYELDA
jgi:TRIAD3 protein (E3 ubiquitin-protein ligase RNF216)